MRRSVDVSPEGVQRLSASRTPREGSQDLQSSLLQVDDADKIMQHAGVHPDDLDVKAFDKDGDGYLSAEEMTALGGAANSKGVANKLAKLLPHTSEQEGKHKEDIALFKSADTDGSSLLEAGEVDALLAKTPLEPGSFDWHRFDFDKDGKLSLGEFLAGGPAVSQQVQQELQRRHQEAQQQASLLEQEAMDQDTQIFRDADKNQDNFLEESEMDALNNRAGLTGFDWKVFDSDKDNRLNLAEFVKSGPAAAEFGQARQMELLLKRTKEGDEADRKIFKQADADGSSFLEEGEVNTLLNGRHIDTKLFNWHAFDHNHDGKLSEEEFLAGGTAALKASLQGPSASLVEESGGDEQEEDLQQKYGDGDQENSNDESHGEGQESDLQTEQESDLQTEQDDLHVWLETDKDHSGYLESNEMEQLMQTADIKDFDWKVYDKDHDGRLSSAEWHMAAGEAKEKASLQFRQKIQEAMGEDMLDEQSKEKSEATTE